MFFLSILIYVDEKYRHKIHQEKKWKLNLAQSEAWVALLMILVTV